MTPQRRSPLKVLIDVADVLVDRRDLIALIEIYKWALVVRPMNVPFCVAAFHFLVSIPAFLKPLNEIDVLRQRARRITQRDHALAMRIQSLIDLMLQAK